MIARVAYFEGLTEEQKRIQEDNANRRFKAAITSQPGMAAIFYFEQPNGDRVSFSVWESEEQMREGGIRANQVPLLPDQRGEDISSATRVEVWSVRDHFVAQHLASGRA